MAVTLQHDPATQCLGVPAPGPRVAAALRGCYGCASATTQGWSVGGQNPNLKIGVIHGGRSHDSNDFLIASSSMPVIAITLDGDE